VIIVLGITTSTALGDATPTGVSYLLHENFGGSWNDAEKTRISSEDDNMCWAAAASNVLAWTGWGQVDGMRSTDEMFGYFQNHWTDAGGQMGYGWQWWMSGYNPSNGWNGWSQVDVAGGGFHSQTSFSSLYHRNSNTYTAMSSLNTYLRSGYGTALAIYGPGGHAITAWGLTHDASNTSAYTGIYITDSDDYKNHPDAPDRLRYYEVELVSGKWHLQNYFGSNSWYIGGVYGLERAPAAPTAPGDVNGDASVNIEDIDLLAAAIRQGEYTANHDLDGDGQITFADREMLIRDILHTEYGDFNLNRIITAGDYTVWASNFGRTNAGWEDGDANGDGIVDGGDYTLWADMMGQVGQVDASQGTPTPEPATMALIFTGAMVVVSRRKSRKR
jgi:hypothetical protein